jgi:lysophospholipase L1-like esterase
MRKTWYRAVLCAALVVWAQAASAAIPKILLVGDSWPWFMMLNQSFTTALDEAGLGQYEAVGIYTTAPGSTARQWKRERWLKKIEEELARYPTIDIVHVSLGGNDYLQEWAPDMPLEERDKLFNGVRDDIEAVVQHILGLRPNIRVAIVEYDYVNATRRKRSEKGRSTIAELNQAGQILAHMKMEVMKKYERTGYIQTYGLMQYHFGMPPDIAPRTAPKPGQWPDFDPWPGGNKELGSPEVSMQDDIHLSPKGYHVLAMHCIDTLYRNWLENPLPPAAPAP